MGIGSEPLSHTGRFELAKSFNATERERDAIPIFEDLLRLRADTDSDALFRLECQTQLTFAYYRTDKLTEAIDLAQSAITESGSRLGEGHPMVSMAKGMLVVAHHRDGNLTAAIALLEDLVKGYQRMLPEDHPQLLWHEDRLAKFRKELHSSQ
jgi:tetratricopeptide (TPR) repeat protein